MKKFNSIITAILFATLLSSAQFQDQKGFNFQGYARDESGAALGNKAVQVKYSLYPAGQPGTVDYTETHSLTTDPYGIFSAVVGSKSVATFAKLPFARVNYWLKVEVKTSATNWSTINEIELLSVPYARTAGNGNPVGSVIAYAGLKTNIPAGYLICDGTIYNKTDYPELSAALGNAWGGNATQFNVPDMRGFFLRGVDESAGRDDNKNSRGTINSGGNSGNTVGTFQGDSYLSHNHTGSGNTSTDGNHYHDISMDKTEGFNGTRTQGSDRSEGGLGQTNWSGNHSHSFSFTTSSNGGNETRPENVAVYYIIKY
ncbi:MAG: tail fiber protein [Bacteroidetes bacterium]|nr:MAG: tail fiber protein [Bacteroidota bacterium]